MCLNRMKISVGENFLKNWLIIAFLVINPQLYWNRIILRKCAFGIFEPSRLWRKKKNVALRVGYWYLV